MAGEPMEDELPQAVTPPIASVGPKTQARIDRRAKREASYAKLPTWALWLYFIAGVAFSAVAVVPLAIIAFGEIGRALAARRGLDKPWLWFVYAGLLLPIAVIHLLLIKPTPEVEHERRASAWATHDDMICGFQDQFAPAMCVKREGHHLAGLHTSPHDYREEARGTL